MEIFQGIMVIAYIVAFGIIAPMICRLVRDELKRKRPQ
jgi:hypothetical protein